MEFENLMTLYFEWPRPCLISSFLEFFNVLLLGKRFNMTMIARVITEFSSPSKHEQISAAQPSRVHVDTSAWIECVTDNQASNSFGGRASFSYAAPEACASFVLDDNVTLSSRCACAE
eukprot:m.36378 g.36378  ORF g.36378 m.36378 type:complete len:118 (-) comp11254_c0_seq8:1252-1605(-)